MNLENLTAESSGDGIKETENTKLAKAREAILHMPLNPKTETYDEETIGQSFEISTPEERKNLNDIFTCIALDDELNEQQRQFLLNRFKD